MAAGSMRSAGISGKYKQKSKSIGPILVLISIMELAASAKCACITARHTKMTKSSNCPDELVHVAAVI